MSTQSIAEKALRENTEAIQDRLRKAAAADGRNLNRLSIDAHARWPSRAKEAWRKAFARSLDGPRPELDTIERLADLFGIGVERILGCKRFHNLPTRPTASTRVTFSVEFHSVGSSDSETRTVGEWLGRKDAEIAAMTWTQIEQDLDAAAHDWTAEHVSSGWGAA